ncbi:hypothetical protein HG530_015754 [Fusarium avenaceum]|nr:hypothetical protein HG530_015754 [Fusarium avenaceum]
MLYILRLLVAVASLSHLIHAFPSIVPVATSFKATNGLPAFSLSLGNDTASVCNSSTPGIAGRLESHDEVESKMFFWVFESKNDPLTDPVILWMSGGPGASSTGYGNLMELGPCRIAHGGGSTDENQFGWNQNASVLFVDQPASVGFSTAKDLPRGLVEASKRMDCFMRQFMLAFPQLGDRDFYIAGESYGGSWVPALASTILETQGDTTNAQPSNILTQKAIPDAGLRSAAGLPYLRLRGILIGNGLVRLRHQNLGALEAACSGPDSILSAAECVEWSPWALWCEQNIGVCEDVGLLSKECKHAQHTCSALDRLVQGKLGRNPYNWQKPCNADDMVQCFPELQWVDDLMGQPKVKAALGVPIDTPYRGLSPEVLDIWTRNGDLFRPSHMLVNELLDKGIRVLLYVGDKDFLVTAAGMRRLVNEGLSWRGHPLFRFRALAPWYYRGKAAGQWKGYDALTYAEIYGAGHLAPMELPAETLSLINSWLFRGRPSSS